MAPSRVALTASLTAATRRQTLQACRGALPTRHYHSHHHPPPPGPFNSTERTILDAAYAHVPEHGFSQQALTRGARDAGYLDISTNLLPDGPFSLIKYHLVTKREALGPRRAAILGAPLARDHGSPDAAAQPPILSVPERVERLTWERLLLNQQVIHRWQEALAIMAQPSRVPASLHELALLADEIYHLAGDVSVDSSWYTKRGSLSAIYASSELFMTNDRSAGFSETRDFLQRRLDETDSVAGALSGVRHWVGFTAAAGVNVLRSKGMRI